MKSRYRASPITPSQRSPGEPRRGACKQKAPDRDRDGGPVSATGQEDREMAGGSAVWRSAASIQAEDRAVLPAKQDIDTDLEDAFGLLDIDWKPEGVSEAGYWSADEVI